MGKGDKKTRRGKIVIKSYGVTRRRKKNKQTGIAVASPAGEDIPAGNTAPKKTTAESKKKESPAEPKPAVKKSTGRKAAKPESETAPE